MAQKTDAVGDGSRKLGSIERVEAYRLALAAGGAAWADGTTLKADVLFASLAPQLVRACGSIAANIAEGYARRSARDRIRYYEYALGSSEEARSWYEISRPGLPADVLDDRIGTLTSIRRLLLVMIKNERRGKSWNSPPP